MALTVIYSKNDNVVDWRACLDDVNEHAEHFEVGSTHWGIGMKAETFEIIALQLVKQRLEKEAAA